MGCDDRESNFQYTFYDPADGKWWCKWGVVQVWAVPRGYEGLLKRRLLDSTLNPEWKWLVRFNKNEQMWEATVRKRPLLPEWTESSGDHDGMHP